MKNIQQRCQPSENGGGLGDDVTVDDDAERF